MDYTIIDMTDEQTAAIADRLDNYDHEHIKYRLQGSASIGVMYQGRLIAGADGCLTAFRIFYVSTVFVEEAYRGRGIGRRLMDHIEKRAISLGANLIRLDTFDWQGVNFYTALGYTQVGSYSSETDGFSEYFFIKRLDV